MLNRQNTGEISTKAFLPNFFIFVGEIEMETSLLVRFEILGLFYKTFNANDKYCCYKREKFRQVIQIKFSKKQKNCISEIYKRVSIF